jgi:hypothetical protein
MPPAGRRKANLFRCRFDPRRLKTAVTPTETVDVTRAAPVPISLCPSVSTKTAPPAGTFRRGVSAANWEVGWIGRRPLKSPRSGKSPPGLSTKTAKCPRAGRVLSAGSREMSPAESSRTKVTSEMSPLRLKRATPVLNGNSGSTAMTNRVAGGETPTPVSVTRVTPPEPRMEMMAVTPIIRGRLDRRGDRLVRREKFNGMLRDGRFPFGGLIVVAAARLSRSRCCRRRALHFVEPT